MADSSSQDRPWVYVLLLACIVVGGVYWLFFSAPKVEKFEQPTFPDGWLDLAECVAFASLDHNKEIKFSENQGVHFWDTSPLKEGEDPKSRIIDGVWSYDTASKQYAITLKGETTKYTLLAKGDPVTCIMFKGDVNAADLSASWFSFPATKEMDEEMRDYLRDR